LRAVTCALATLAPPGSLTVPTIVAVVDCAHAPAGTSNSAMTARWILIEPKFFTLNMSTTSNKNFQHLQNATSGCCANQILPWVGTPDQICLNLSDARRRKCRRRNQCCRAAQPGIILLRSDAQRCAPALVRQGPLSQRYSYRCFD